MKRVGQATRVRIQRISLCDLNASGQTQFKEELDLALITINCLNYWTN